MAMNDPVLQRSMFSGPRSAPSSPAATGAGVGSLTTPDQNAQALRGLFRAPPSTAFPAPGMQPIQSFQTGGEVVDNSGAFPGTEPIPREPPAPPAESLRPRPSRLKITPDRFSETPPSAPAPTQAGAVSSEGFLDRNNRAGAVLGGIYDLGRSLLGARFRRITGEGEDRPLVLPQEGPLPPSRPTQPGEVPPFREEPRDVPVAAVDRAQSVPERAPAPAAPSVSTSLEEIRSRREAREAALTAAERRENGLLALMQAGFATAAGTSPNALSNIGAGGQAGIAAFANLEKSRREDAAARRRDKLSREISTAQLQKEPDQIRTLAMMGGWTPDQGREGLQAAVAKGMQIQKSMQPEPEMIRTFQILGGGDVRKGFELYNADKKLQAAIAVTKDITAADEDRKAANEYIRGQITQARTGGSSAFPGFRVSPAP